MKLRQIIIPGPTQQGLMTSHLQATTHQLIILQFQVPYNQMSDKWNLPGNNWSRPMHLPTANTICKLPHPE